MCLTIPGKIIKIKDKKAKIGFGRNQRNVSIGMLKVKVGDYVLVTGDLAVQKISKREALKTKKIWNELLKQNL